MRLGRSGGCDDNAITIPAMKRNERWLWGAVAIAAAAALLPTLTPGIIGLFHDDAIYASGARLLAEGGGYHLPNLPDSPFQTKYPPFYPALLALIWRIQPEFPANILFLKALNLGFVAASVMGIGLLARAQNPNVSWTVPLGCQLVLATNPMLVGFSDYTMTDVLFTALAVWIVWLWGSSGSEMSLRGEATVVAVSAVALLTRSVGVALTTAIVLDCLLQRQRARAALHAGMALIVLTAWFLWASMHRANDSPLIAYYQEYERSALSYLMTDPKLAWEIVGGNIRLVADSMFIVMGISWILIWPALLVPLIVGAVQLVRSGWRMPLLFSSCYLALVILHPFAPYRYLLPLAPLCVLATARGATHLWALVRGSNIALRRPASVPAVTVLAVLLFGNGVWLRPHYQADGRVRWWNGRETGYGWDGFEETFDWVRHHTPQEARLGAFYDPMYFLYTGREAVRPWLHRSETYFYPYGATKPFVGRPEQVAKELRALCIDFLVLDPPAGYAEGPAAIELLRAVISLPETNAQLVFTSRDGLHEVYRLGEHPEMPPDD